MLLHVVHGKGSVQISMADKLAGRVGHVARVVPEARPFAGTFWTALSAGRSTDQHGPREAPLRRKVARRFQAAAMWILALIDVEAGDESWHEAVAPGAHGD